ncbi:MAG: hypothetical protein KBE00_06565 [Syntrophaceae bacterium]|nr:hypothetical protein [Syntrophaceae bacterium]
MRITGRSAEDGDTDVWAALHAEKSQISARKDKSTPERRKEPVTIRFSGDRKSFLLRREPVKRNEHQLLIFGFQNEYRLPLFFRSSRYCGHSFSNRPERMRLTVFLA